MTLPKQRRRPFRYVSIFHNQLSGVPIDCGPWDSPGDGTSSAPRNGSWQLADCMDRPDRVAAFLSPEATFGTYILIDYNII